MDVRLPGISGVESFQAIRQISPGARVVIMTGYSVDHLLRQAIDAGAWAIMQKPLEMNSILRMAETIQPRGLALIADDDPDFAQTLRALLSRRGYAALLARGGAEALKIASENELDFLILDVRLPEANGLEVCRTLRERGIDCPIILVTGYAQEECDSIQAMKRHDAIGPLAKPFDEDGLMRAIAEACGRRR
ncbi:MAG: Response regulator receiver protein [candidate division BRC1 bacterium ADurb.BinA364]|nr:MAG: Response regulator receiver protein [candidate division BRC1 bacterium ADurb.BinA364]